MTGAQVEHSEALRKAAEAIERMLVAVRAAAGPDATGTDVYEHLSSVLREMGPLHNTILSVRTEVGLLAIDELPASPPKE